MPGNDADLIFPSRVIPELRDSRGTEWQEFIDRISGLTPDSLDRVALVLMIVRLSGCVSCQADSFKAMRGCALCATQSLRRFRSDDRALIRQVESAKKELINTRSSG